MPCLVPLSIFSIIDTRMCSNKTDSKIITKSSVFILLKNPDKLQANLPTSAVFCIFPFSGNLLITTCRSTYF